MQTRGVGEKKEPLPWAGGRLARSDRPPSTGAESKTKPILAVHRASALSANEVMDCTTHFYVTVWSVCACGNTCFRGRKKRKHVLVAGSKQLCVGACERDADKLHWAHQDKASYLTGLCRPIGGGEEENGGLSPRISRDKIDYGGDMVLLVTSLIYAKG